MNALFKALADPTRREILSLLKDGDKNAGEIGSHFNMTGASISHHLSILTNAELVLRDKQGQNVVYSLNTTVFQSVIEWFFNLKGEEENEEN